MPSKAYNYTNSKGQTYILHSKVVTLRGGREQRIYYFARDERDGALEAVPEGYYVVENKKTGLPMLKREE